VVKLRFNLLLEF